MKRWFAHLPVGKKLAAAALIVSTVTVVVTLIGFTLFDIGLYRTRAVEDVETLAGIVAENSAAAVVFLDQPAAAQTLATVRLREAVLRACLYLASGELFASYQRDGSLFCPLESVPVAEGLFNIAAAVPILWDNQTWGTVYVERDFAWIYQRLAIAGAAGAAMLLIVSGLTFSLSRRLSHNISGPISRLAAEAKGVGTSGYAIPDIPAGEDEVGDLVRAFRSMSVRVRDANDGLVREIDERKKIEAEREVLLERERETSRLKDEFVATVSHELRTPLSAIMGWTQVLETARLDQQTLDKAINVIAKNARLQARIIDDLVDVSRIGTGKLHLLRENLDLRTPVEAGVDLAKSAAARKGVRIDMRLPSWALPVKGDGDRLCQVVENLVSNAVKFSEGGSLVSVVAHDRGPIYEIEVTDQGVGIAPAVLPYVFDRFRQADSSTTRRHGGLGLGLAIVKEVTELHGGSVSAASPGEGLGSSFRVRLPATVDIPSPREEPRRDVGQPARLDGVHVLAVDDNADALDVLAVGLRAAGATVRTATSGEAALEAWEDAPPDILLCDLAMPEMDGFDVLARIRELEGERDRHTAAIAVSAHATQEHRRRSIAAGFAGHVAKPYQISDLVRAVSAALNG